MKKGQSSAGAAGGLVGLITVFIIFYILFLPPGERHELLDENNGDSSDDNNDDESEYTLLSEGIGRLSPLDANGTTHLIPNVYLSSEANAMVLASENSFKVANGLFTEKKKTIIFSGEEIIPSSIAISFQAPAIEGDLIMKINGQQIFESELASSTPTPVKVPSSVVQDSNTLEISVSGTGIRFWDVNRYEISGLQVIGESSDISKKEAVNRISLTTPEYNQLSKASLSFWPSCEQKKNGLLTISINENSVYSAIPDCDSINKFELAKEDLSAGTNKISFKTDKGSYTIEQIKLKTEIDEKSAFVQYFEVNSTIWSDIDDNNRDIILNITFVDDRAQKRADININGHLTSFDTKNSTYLRDITGWVVKGNRNYIQLTPRTELNIVQLQITAEEN